MYGGRSNLISSVESRLARIAAAYAPDPRFLAILRISFGLWMMIFPIDIGWIDVVPAEFFHARPGFFFFLTGPPDNSVLLALVILKVALGALLAAGIWTLPVSFALSATLIVTSGIVYSYSKVDHFILFELVPVFLGLAGWGWTWSVDSWLKRRRRHQLLRRPRGMPVLLYAMTIGWAMLSAAVPKVVGDWLNPDRYATRGYLARDLVRDEKLGPLGPWALDAGSDVMWKFLDYATVVAEAGLILVVFAPMIFRLWLLLLGSFHVGVYLVLGISFVDYVLVYAVFFSPVFVWLFSRGSRLFASVGTTTADLDFSK